MTKTLAGTYSSLYTLSGTADNPATITATGLLQAGLYADNLISTAWTITNSGSVLGSGVALASSGTVVNAGSIAGNATSSSGRGIGLLAGGSVTNQSGAMISGFDGIFSTAIAPETVVNYGSIAGNATSGIGVKLEGSLTNQSGGVISGYRGVVYGGAGALTVVNAGSITGNTASSSGIGADLSGGGSLTNQSAGVISGFTGVEFLGSLTNESAGVISGFRGIYGNGALGTVAAMNFGSITGDTGSSSGIGAELSGGGSLTNVGTGVIDGFRGVFAFGGPGFGVAFGVTTIVNSGTITGNTTSASGKGVMLEGIGSVTNQSGGTISGFIGLYSGSGPDPGGEVTVLNFGSIAGNATSVGGAGVTLGAGVSVTNQSGGAISGFDGISGGAFGAGTVVNYGSIAGNTLSGMGVALSAGGSVTNQASASISGSTGVSISGGIGTVLNAGQILSSGSHTAVVLDLGGVVTNQAGGTITGGTAHGAVYITGAAGTVTNYGQLTGGGVAGVHLQAGGTVTNQSGGTITSGTNHAGVYVTGGSAGVVSNAGLISGVDLFSGGGVTNMATGTIDNSNAAAVDVAGAAGTLVNAGHIVSGGTHTAVYLKVGGTVTNALGGYIMGGGPGIDITGNTSGIVTNAGVILSGGTHSGVVLLHGGYINNALTGTIGAIGGDAVYIGGGIGTVINAGSLDGGTVGPSVQLVDGGVISNVASGVIFGVDHSGVYSIDVAATVLNAGIITGAGTSGTGGVAFKAGGYVSNAATGTITSVQNPGVFISGGTGTIINAGTIAGAGGTTAVVLASSFTDRLVTDPGAVFGGTVNGGNTIDAAAVSTLEFASGSSAGTLHGLDSQYINFAQITIDAGASWAMTGANTIAAGVTLTELTGATVTDTGMLANYGSIIIDPSTLDAGGLTGTGSATIAAGSTLDVSGTIATGETIKFAGSSAYLYLGNPSSVGGSVTNFDVGETILLKGVAAPSVNYAAGVLSFAGGSFALSLSGSGTPNVSAGPNGAEFSLLCFCIGTRILTPSGERQVQELAVGDMVTTHRGAARRIEWIGTGKVLATRGRRNAATPVIVRKGALADNVPCRDLRVTKGHSLYLDDVLIPVEFLVNHRSILWDDRAQEVAVYHIELETHDVLIADGAPAESYRDDGNRWLFQNINSGWASSPLASCAPVLTGGSLVDAIWRRLLDRAGPRPGFVLTDDPDLHLLVDGLRVDPADWDGTAYTFRLPTRPTSVHVVSRAGAPAEMGVANDPRVLAVALRRITLLSGTSFHQIEADDPLLADGFHAFEAVNGLRWTNGDAVLPAALFDGIDHPLELKLYVGCTTQYPLFGEARFCAAD